MKFIVYSILIGIGGLVALWLIINYFIANVNSSF